METENELTPYLRLTRVPQLNPGVSWTWTYSARRRLAGRIATDTGRGPRSSWGCVRAEGRAAHAFSHQRLLIDVARDVVARRLVFTPDMT